MLNGIQLPEEYELISVFSAIPTHPPQDFDVHSYYKEHIYQFSTAYEKVKISFSPAVNDFFLHTYDLRTKQEITSLCLQDSVRSLQILHDTKEKATVRLDCGFSLEGRYQNHLITIDFKPRVKIYQQYYISWI